MIDKLIITTSWDDGTVFDSRVAELMDKYNVRGTFYVPKTSCPKMLTPGEIRSIKNIFGIGAHTLNHTRLRRIPLAQVRNEVEGSKSYLEDIVGSRVELFCYPGGEYNDNIINIVKESGFKAARTTNLGGFGYADNPYKWPVTMIASNGSPLRAAITCVKFKLTAKAYYDWETRAKELFEKALTSGGIFHIYGHSLEFETSLQWGRFENILKHISGNKGCVYLNNEDVFLYR